MKKIIYVVFFLSIVLILNILAYFISDDYRFFLKKLKYNWNIPNSQIISDNYNNDFKVWECNCELPKNNTSQNTSNTWTKSIEKNNSLSWVFVWSTWPNSQTQSWIIQWLFPKEFDEFKQKFPNAKLLEKPYDDYYKVFDITDEYLWNYYTLTSTDIEIYYFTWNTFESVFDFFQAVSYDLPITVNRVDNFATKSFYINKKEKDDFIRLIIEYDRKIFWLKIKNAYYNEVKNILNQL